MNSFNEQDTDMNDNSISSWISHDYDDASGELGEEVVQAILMEMGDE